MKKNKWFNHVKFLNKYFIENQIFCPTNGLDRNIRKTNNTDYQWLKGRYSNLIAQNRENERSISWKSTCKVIEIEHQFHWNQDPISWRLNQHPIKVVSKVTDMVNK